MKPLTTETLEKAFEIPKKPEVIEKQRLAVRYHIEDKHLVDNNRPQKFLEAMAAILKHSNYRFVLDHYIRTSAKCSRCTVQCQVYEATKDLRDIPCYRSELLLKVYRRHFTVAGTLRGRLTNDPGLTDDDIEDMARSFYDCTACRRCQNECPAGIDHGMITHLGRYILSEIGIVPRALVVSTREQLIGDSHNTSAIPVPALKDTLEFLEEEMAETKGVEVKFPLDVEGADYIFIPAVSDFLMEAETLMGNACVFHATGDSWTIGTGDFDGINYGLFYSDHVLEKVLLNMEKEVERLKIKKGIIIGECGHASRSAKFFYNNFAERFPMPVINCMEYAHDALEAGKLKFDRSIIKETVTYHDPCNIARSGWIIKQPRELIKAFIDDFVEMDKIGKDAVCCGGGGGTVSLDEIRPYRTTIGGYKKAKQITATIKEGKAHYTIGPCANCKKQLKELIEDQNIPSELVGLHDLIYRAIILSDDGVAWREPEGIF
ncbi:MAG: (Fe-S)-binding protein [Candidatus Electryonea clarkiae]|nr:(Fe-S)-binding protein [Candidatus Electryonea clarkiae]MDP8285265.1 (Fe-S)-binding protein [Candidatus Electryonea clarkiae]